MMATVFDIAEYTDRYLEIGRYKDYCPNGLQVESSREITRLICGVTACLDLIDAAADAQADAILVHHGYFWRGEDESLTGMKARRVRRLFETGIGLLAYHLPLDAHPEVGNNVQLAQLLGMRVEGPLEDDLQAPIGVRCRLDATCSASKFAAHIADVLDREPTMIADEGASVETVGLCTGAAQDYIGYAVKNKLDAFISGEISERTTHIAREEGVCYYAAGHHATERYGVQALAQHLSEQFNFEAIFIDIDNPV